MAHSTSLVSVKMHYKELVKEFLMISGKLLKDGSECSDRVWVSSIGSNVNVDWIKWCLVNQLDYIELPTDRCLLESYEVLSHLFDFTSTGLLFTKQPLKYTKAGHQVTTGSRIKLNGIRMSYSKVLYTLYHKTQLPSKARVAYLDGDSKNYSKVNLLVR